MDALKFLKQEHDTVDEMFKDYESASDRAVQTKIKLAKAIVKELEAHITIEEEVFYPRLLHVRDHELKDKTREGVEEHLAMKRIIADLHKMTVENEQYDAKMKVLREEVEHHVKEEEDEMFPNAKSSLSVEELEELGTAMELRKEELMQNDAERQKLALEENTSIV